MAETQYNKFASIWLTFKNKKDKWNLAEAYVEKPAMYTQVGDLHGKTVLCLGCGSGKECEYLKKHGAEKVVGVDISRKLIHYAKANVTGCEFKVVNMEKLSFPDNSFDIVYSSLAIHYLRNWTKLFSKINPVLKSKGIFLFSIPHPIRWTARTIRDEVSGQSSFLLGYSNNKKTGEYHIYGDYLNARKVTDNWFIKSKLKVYYYVKPLSSIFMELLKSGFDIVEFLEPKAINKTKKVNPIYWEIRNKIPLYAIFKLRKNN